MTLLTKSCQHSRLNRLHWKNGEIKDHQEKQSGFQTTCTVIIYEEWIDPRMFNRAVWAIVSYSHLKNNCYDNFNFNFIYKQIIIIQTRPWWPAVSIAILGRPLTLWHHYCLSQVNKDTLKFTRITQTKNDNKKIINKYFINDLRYCT